MDSRQRFLEIMDFKKNIKTLKWEFGYWYDTCERWYEEGLPKKAGISPYSDFMVRGESFPTFERDVQLFDIKNSFDLDTGWLLIPLNLWFDPLFEVKIIEEDDDYKIFVDAGGTKQKVKKHGTTMPQFLSYPVKDRKDFEKIKERFDPNTVNRIPQLFFSLLHIYNTRNFPIILGPCSFFGFIRQLVGFENLCYMLYTDIELIKDMASCLLNLYKTVLDKVIPLVTPAIDAVYVWEDMAFKNGPLIAPQMFKEIFSSYYKDLISFFNDYKINNIIVDSDGNLEKLIPIFLDCGITGILPFEIAADMDLVKIRKAYPNLQILGGVDKRKLKSKELIDKELEKIEYLSDFGGYVPHIDHLVPSDISWENFKYYRNKLNKIIDSKAKD